MISEDYKALTESAACIDASNRGRLCLLGADRQNFLHGQVSNDVKRLKIGEGCYAALANNKGKMTSDLNIFILENEILLDFELGLTAKVTERLEKFIIADDVQIVDASASFGMIRVFGPKAVELCDAPRESYKIVPRGNGYIATTAHSVNIYFPIGEAPDLNLPKCSCETLETRRIELGIPRFGADMDENTLVPEAIEDAISYTKGCYIGQEVIARIRTYGQVAKALRGLRFEPGASPKPGDKLLHDGKEVGWITSAAFSPKLQTPIALGYVRKECNQIGTKLGVAEIVPLPIAP